MYCIWHQHYHNACQLVLHLASSSTLMPNAVNWYEHSQRYLDGHQQGKVFLSNYRWGHRHTQQGIKSCHCPFAINVRGIRRYWKTKSQTLAQTILAWLKSYDCLQWICEVSPIAVLRICSVLELVVGHCFKRKHGSSQAQTNSLCGKSARELSIHI